MKFVNSQKFGHLEIYTGCMFSGKTDALIATLFRLKQVNQNILVFKPAVDFRSGKAQIISQTRKTWPAIPVKNPEEMQIQVSKVKGLSAVAIDETQFFELNLVPFIEKLLDSGINVYISGLDRGFSDNDLPVMNRLLALADRVTKLFAYCNKCGAVANKTQRVDSAGNATLFPIKTDKQFVGGTNLYEARCRKCYIRFARK